MWTRITRFIVILAYIGSLIGCKQHESQPIIAPVVAPTIPPDSALEASSQALAHVLRSFNLVHPEMDLNAHLLRGDHRFVGINGYACAAPGLDYSAGPNDEQNFVSLFGIACIPGTSDVLDQQLFELQEGIASKYATTYNQELLRRIRSGIVVMDQLDKATP